MPTLSTHLKTSVAALCVAIPGAAFAEAPILVTSSADTGEGSLRAALDAAAASGASSIITLTPGNNIELASGLIYSGTDALAIHGNGTRITSGANVTLLTASEGANLTLTDLTLQGSGGFDINHRGDIDETAGKGIFVDVRDDQTGLVTLRLSDVTVANVAGHGVHISDCSLADDCGGGGGGAGEGSPASISVVFSDVTIDGVGQGRFDADGLRVDERSAGSTHLVATGSTFTGAGSILATVTRATISDNYNEGLDFDEEGAGSIALTIFDSIARGDTHVVSFGGMTMGNDDGDTGFEIVQDDNGAGTFKVMGTTISDGTDIEGVMMADG
ncbi:MAG: hypothetical protein KJO30_10460 [Boseongicola sp.]|nr:hypothetical protein [Boseongicola sp.]